MKKTIILVLMAAVAAVSCKKQESVQFQFATNPFTRSAELGGGIQTFGFISPNDWNITWDEVDWVTIEQSELSGKAAKNEFDWHTVTMTVLPNRRNEDRQVQFTVNEGGLSHIMTIIETKPLLPEQPLVFTAKGMDNPGGGTYEFTAPAKYEITVTSDSEWLTIGEVDYEANRVAFAVAPLPEGSEKRTGKISVLLSDGAVLGTLTVNQAE